MIDERWKLIEGHEGYAVSTMGRVYSIKKDIMLKPFFTKNNYEQVSLCKKGVIKKQFIHRLVGEVFIQNYFNLPEIDHIDRDKSNNSVNNLRWASRKINNNNQGDKQKSQEKYAKPVLATNLETGEEERFEYVKDAVRKYGMSLCKILKGTPCKDGRGNYYTPKTCKGHTFSYI